MIWTGSMSRVQLAELVNSMDRAGIDCARVVANCGDHCAQIYVESTFHNGEKTQVFSSSTRRVS